MGHAQLKKALFLPAIAAKHFSLPVRAFAQCLAQAGILGFTAVLGPPIAVPLLLLP